MINPETVMTRGFGVVALDMAAWGMIAGFGVVLFMAVELEKRVIRKLGERNMSRS